MKAVFLPILLFMFFLLSACTAEQVKSVEEGLASQAPLLVAAVSEAYGPEYGNLVNSFFQVAGYYEQTQVQGAAQYPAFPATATPAAGRLQVDIDVLKEAYVGGRYQALSVADGDVLTRQDNYKVAFRANTSCYVYIVQLDATGKMDPIFPGAYAGASNPVQAGTLYTVPANGQWFFLDQNTGIETIYFIVSQTRRPDLDRLVQQFAQTNPTLVQLSPLSLQQNVSFTRGIAGVRPGDKQPVSFQNGSQGQYSSTQFTSSAEELVLTRWFHHR